MYKKLIILTVFFLIYLVPIQGQCLNDDSLLKKISFLRDSSGLSAFGQIKALSPYDSEIAACTHNHDSIHVVLINRIGNLFSSVAEYAKGIVYYQRSIDLINKNAAKNSPVNLKHLIPRYYWLSVFYDSLHRITDKMKALDSCSAIAIRLKSIDTYCLWALLSRAEYSFDIGDYHRCIDYANLCESLSTDFASKGSKHDYDYGMQYANSSLLQNINALIILKKYDDAEILLEKKANECRENKLVSNLGFIYGSLAEVLELKGDFEKVLFYQNKAFAIEKRLGRAVNCKAILNDLGYEVWFRHYQNADKALEYFRRALNYKVNKNEYPVLNSLESLSILNRIANVYVLKGKYDDALRYIQLAFDQIKSGISETEVLHSSLDEFIRQRRIGYIATLIVDKAAALHQKYKAIGAFIENQKSPEAA